MERFQRLDWLIDLARRAVVGGTQQAERERPHVGETSQQDGSQACRRQKKGKLSVWPATRQAASSLEIGRAVPRRRGNSHVDRTRVQRRELRYDSPEFRAASEFARRLPDSPPVSSVVGNVIRDPALIRAIVAIWRLPVVDVRVRRDEADGWLGAVGLADRERRWAQAVLDLPIVEKHYLTGRPKQALRTNLRHARNLGVTSERIPTYEAWFEDASVILDARHCDPAVVQEIGKPGSGQQLAYYVARDADKTPLAFAYVAQCGQYAVLMAMLSHLDRYPSASWARYQLHTFLSLDLGRSGVKHLIVGSALRTAAGHQYFQHLLGYRARNLRIEVT